MRSKPITQKSKSSPLNKLNGPGAVPTPKGEATVNVDGYVYDADDNVDIEEATGATPPKTVPKKLPSYSEAYKGVDKTKYPTLESFVTASEDYKTNNPEKFKEMSTTVVPGSPGTPASGKRTVDMTPRTTEARDADMVDTFLPWERRFAQRTQRGAVRDEKKRGRKALRDLNKSLESGFYSEEKGNMDEYKKRKSDAETRSLGQGPIATSQYQNDQALQAITSQGYQANPAVSTQTEYKRKLNEEQEAGQKVKATGNEDYTYDEYMDDGISEVKPKTSAPEQAKASEASSVSQAQSMDLRDVGTVDTKAPMGSEAPAKPQKRSSSTEMFNTNEQADEIFGDDGVVVRGSRGVVGGKGVETDPMAGIESASSDLELMDPSVKEYGVNIETAVADDMSEASRMLEADLASDRSAFKMRRDHKSSMMYNKSPLNLKDLSGDGVVTQKDVLIGRGVIDKQGTPINMNKGAKNIITGKSSTAFKMKGYGKK